MDAITRELFFQKSLAFHLFPITEPMTSENTYLAIFKIGVRLKYFLFIEQIVSDESSFTRAYSYSCIVITFWSIYSYRKIPKISFKTKTKNVSYFKKISNLFFGKMHMPNWNCSRKNFLYCPRKCHKSPK